jgi:hypothetical protein
MAAAAVMQLARHFTFCCSCCSPKARQQQQQPSCVALACLAELGFWSYGVLPGQQQVTYAVLCWQLLLSQQQQQKAHAWGRHPLCGQLPAERVAGSVRQF